MDKEQIIGVCAIADEEGYYEIEHLWILPTYIGKGLGNKLLKASMNLVCTERKDILVTADPNAESFYSVMEFNLIKRVESYPEGKFLPIMKKKLRILVCLKINAAFIFSSTS